MVHTPPITVEDAIQRERREACNTGYKRIVHIRVTPHAMPGSLVSVPISPERARNMGIARSDFEEALEILLHPEDWQRWLLEAGGLLIGNPAVVHGLPVRHAA
jgi:hypothetical protein